MGTLVSICVCTFMRESGLKRVLDSIVALELPNGVEVEIIVVDNDVNASGEHVVVSRRAEYPASEMRYVVEPLAGVAHARTRALREARGELIAFIDDDETVVSQWLRRAYATLTTSGADAVFGPIIPHYEAKPPLWLEADGLQNRPRFKSGAAVSWGDARCGNVLFRQNVAHVVGGFDPAFAITGGEDSLFFGLAATHGAAFVWDDDAVVIESVPCSRMSLGWQLSRAVHGGRTFVRLRARLHGRQAFILDGVRGIGGVIVFGPVAVVLWIAGSNHFFRYARRAAGGLGKCIATVYSAGQYGRRKGSRAHEVS